MFEVEYRWYQDSDEEQIIELLNIVFRKWPNFDLKCTKAEHWNWKFKDNPLKRNIICLAEHNKRIIGVTESIHLRTKIGSRMYMDSADYDNAVHPDFQGCGIYSNLWDFWSKHPDSRLSEIEISSTSNPIVIKKFLKSGARPFPKKINILTKVRNFTKATKEQTLPIKIYHFIGFTVLSLINGFSNIFMRRIKSENNTVSEVEMFTDEIVPFIEKMYRKHDFIFARSVDYLNWRYCDIRGGDYMVWIARKNSQIVGYLVCRVNAINKVLNGVIVDFLVDPDHQEVAYDLCDVGMEYFDEFDVCRITAWMVQGHWLGSVLSSFGFINSRREAGVFVEYDISSPDEIMFTSAPPSKLHLQIGDTDII